MSFLKRLFGGGSGSPEAAAHPAEEYKGFAIRATPFLDGGQHQTCGVISKDIGGTTREHRFVRADRFSSADEAAGHAMRKGKQIVDEQGDRLFDL